MMASYSIVSLLDMLKFYAHHFIMLSTHLSTLKQLCASGTTDVSGTANGTVTALEQHCESLGLMFTKMACESLRATIASLPAGTLDYFVKNQLANSLGEIQVRLQDELSMRFFLSLDEHEAKLYAPGDDQIGPEFQKHFPNLLEDAVEASKCLGLGRFTAAVFHLMRVTEGGVQKFGDKLGVALLDHRGREKNWQNLLDESSKRIKVIASQSPIDPLAQRYSAVASHLYNVKVAWRNEVMHPKATYTEEEATEIYNATRRFMRELISLL